MNSVSVLVLLAIVLSSIVVPAPRAEAQISDGVVKIGVLTDLSGVFKDISGQGSVLAANLAVEDHGRSVAGMPIVVMSADHQNKPDVAVGVARRWLDDGVDAIADLPNSAVAITVSQLMRDRNKVVLVSGGGSSDLTGRFCSPTLVHWTYDTWALATGLAKGVVDTGGTDWFLVTADYAFGHNMERDLAAAVTARGGRISGSVRHPLLTPDVAPYLQQAERSGANVIGIVSFGADAFNAIKKAADLGIGGSRKLATPFAFITDVDRLGLQSARGLHVVEPFYWDRTPETRAWSKRFAERHNGVPPTAVHAGVYASVLHYLKVVDSLRSDDGARVALRMKQMATSDPLFGDGVIRGDGRKVHPMYLFRVKTPAESTGRWDYYTLLRTIPASDAFRPEGQGGCSLPPVQTTIAAVRAPSLRRDADSAPQTVAPLPRAADPAPMTVSPLPRRDDRAPESVAPLASAPAPQTIAPMQATPTPVAPPAPIPAELGQYHALVIGNQAYRHLARLKTPAADARDVADVFRREYGFTSVKVLLDATRADMIRALDDLRRKLTDRDNLVVYYAGHGYLDQDADRGYWLPIDAEADSRANWLSNGDVTDTLRALRAKHVLIVADSCYSGTLTRNISIVPLGPPDVLALARRRARTVLTSGGLEPVSDTGGASHSVFAKAFLEALRANQGVTDMTSLFADLRRAVMLNAEQTPRYSDMRQAGHDGGDFVFARPGR